MRWCNRCCWRWGLGVNCAAAYADYRSGAAYCWRCEAVLEQARRFLEIRWLSAPRRWRIWYYLVGYSACNMPVRSNFVGGRQYPQHCAGCLAGVGLHMNVQGAALATVIAEYAHC